MHCLLQRGTRNDQFASQIEQAINALCFDAQHGGTRSAGWRIGGLQRSFRSGRAQYGFDLYLGDDKRNAAALSNDGLASGGCKARLNGIAKRAEGELSTETCDRLMEHLLRNFRRRAVLVEGGSEQQPSFISRRRE